METKYEIDSSHYETGISEEDMLGVMLCQKDVDFTKIKQTFDVIANALNFKYTLKDVEHKSFIPGRCGKIMIKGEEVGIIGEIHPKVLENFEIQMPTSSFEVNLNKLYKIIGDE